MSILGLDQVLQFANQYQALADGGDGGDGGDGDRRGRGRGQLRRGRGRGQLRRGRGRGRLGRGLMQANHNRQGEARRAGALSSMKQRQLVRQSLHFNKTGHARTLDHQLPGQDFKRRKPTGKGKWKTWTPEAVLWVGFGNETATCRQLANEVEGASPQELSRFRHLFATFCDPDANPAWANLQELLGILKDPEPFLALLVWKFGPVAQWLAAGSEIGFALAAIPLAFMAAGLERCGRSEAQRVCPRSAEEPDLLFGQ